MKKKKVFLAGGSGFLGRIVVVRLCDMGYAVIAPRSKEHDLTKLDDCIAASKGADVLVHSAGLVTSRSHQLKHPADIFYVNSVMTLQLLEAARRNRIPEVLLVGSMRAYPDRPSPLKESYLLEAASPSIKGAAGFYGLSKWVGVQAGRAYAEEYKSMKVRLVIFPNLYGPHDKFDAEEPPLVPAFIKKIMGAAERRAPMLNLGDNPRTNLDLLYGDDACDLLVRVVERFGGEPFDMINGGSGRSYELQEIARSIASAVGFDGTITWSGDEGTPPFFLDITKAEGFGWRPRVGLDEGLRRTVQSFVKHYAKK